MCRRGRQCRGMMVLVLVCSRSGMVRWRRRVNGWGVGQRSRWGFDRLIIKTGVGKYNGEWAGIMDWASKRGGGLDCGLGGIVLDFWE